MTASAEHAERPPRRPVSRGRWLFVCACALLLAAATVATIRSRREHSRDRANLTPPSAAVMPPDRLGDSALADALEAQQQGDLPAALAHVERALSQNNERVDAYLLKSELLFRLHRSEEMIPALERAIALEPDRFEAHANLAYALQYAGRIDDAEREAQWCLLRQPGHARVRRILAEIRRDQGDMDAAMSQIRLALHEEPNNVECRVLEAELLIFRRQFDTAYLRLSPLLSQQSQNPQFLAVLSRAARLSGRDDEAARHQAAVLRLLEQRQ